MAKRIANILLHKTQVGNKTELSKASILRPLESDQRQKAN